MNETQQYTNVKILQTKKQLDNISFEDKRKMLNLVDDLQDIQRRQSLANDENKQDNKHLARKDSK